MPSTAKLCIWVPRRWLAELERLGEAHGTTPAGYVRILVDEAVGGLDEQKATHRPPSAALDGGPSTRSSRD